MKKLLFGLLLAATSALAQTPDCVIPFTITSGQASVVTGCGKNSQGVFDWRMVYFANGYSALQMEIQSAPDSGNSPGTWATFVGTVQDGSNPATSTTNGSTRVTGYNPWVRVLLSGTTGTGTVSGVLYGCREPGCGGTGLDGGGGSGCTAPCVVIGPDAVGAVPTEPPVQSSGFDGTNVRRVLTDTSGRGRVVGAAADGAAVAGDPVRVAGKDGSGNVQDILTDSSGRVTPALASVAGADGVSNTLPSPTTEAGVQLYNRNLNYLYNGASNDRAFTCNLSAAITVAAGTDVVIVPSGGGATITKICHVSLSSNTVANMSILQGTGTTCGSNQVSLTGAYQNVLAAAYDWSPLSALRNTVAARDTCLHFSTAVTAGGLVIYAQY